MYSFTWRWGRSCQGLQRKHDCAHNISSATAVPFMNGDSDIKCDWRQISCISVSSASTLCSCHVLEFHLQISPVSNCSMKLKIVICFWCMETEGIRLGESFKWHCVLFSFWVHVFLQSFSLLLHSKDFQSPADHSQRQKEKIGHQQAKVSGFALNTASPNGFAKPG